VARASPQQHRPRTEDRAGGSGRVDMPLAIDLGRARKKLEKKKQKGIVVIFLFSTIRRA
jgi:hypothetical protein